MPERTVWCVSSSRRTKRAVSSSCRRWMAVMSLSSSPLALGWTAMDKQRVAQPGSLGDDGLVLRREGVAGQHARELGDGDDVAGGSGRDGLGLLAAHGLEGVQLLLGVRAAVDEGHVRAERA